VGKLVLSNLEKWKIDYYTMTGGRETLELEDVAVEYG
jgi:hypothetical protein